ncbi:MAG: efflux RND transporter periplasmic adaptor subunit [Cyanobacteria bacterium P01_A01_bin.37]
MTSNSFPPDVNATDLALGSRFFDRIQRYPRRTIGFGALGLLLLLGIPVVYTRLAGSSVESANANQINVLPVETFTVETVDSYDVARAYTGEIAALRASDLGFEQGGQLVDVYVQEGDRISAGAPLARLDTRNLQTQRLQLNAEKARAIAQLTELTAGPRAEDIAAAAAAVRDLEQQLALEEARQTRRAFLYNEGAISREELDETSFGQGALEARLDQAQSNLEELQNGTRQEQIDAQRALVQQLDARIADLDVTISKSTLNAPYDGIIATRQVDEGTVLSPGQPVLRLVEDAAPEARIGMPTDITNQLRVGTPQTLRLGTETYSATVDSVLPEVDPETRTQMVVFRLESAAISRISPGQTVRVDLMETAPTDGVWLPTGALTQGIRGLWNCYVLISPEDSTPDVYEVQPQAVEILHQEGDRVLVRGTVQSGDRIVASGTHRLVPGQQVKPL